MRMKYQGGVLKNIRIFTCTLLLLPVIAIPIDCRAELDSGLKSLKLAPLLQSPSTFGSMKAESSATTSQITNHELAIAVGKFLGKRTRKDSQVVQKSDSPVEQKQKRSARISSTESVVGQEISVRFGGGGRAPRQIKHQDKGKQYDAVLQQAVSYLLPGKERDRQTAKMFLKAKKGLLRLANPEEELKMSRYAEDMSGRKHIRYQQRFKGLNVWPAELNVHLDQYGNVDLYNGTSIPTPRKMITRPVWERENAIAAARAEVPDGENASVSSSELIIYAPGNKPPRLAWKLNLIDGVLSDWLVVVDAQTGKTLSAFNQVKNVDVAGSGQDLHGVTQNFRVWQEAVGNYYYMLDTSKSMFDDANSNPPAPNATKGAVIILDAGGKPADPFKDGIPNLYFVRSTDNTWNIPDAVGTMFGLAKTYDYYETIHGRKSIDNKGMNVIGVVRYGPTTFANAFWSGQSQKVFFGSGDFWAGTLDLAAHEFTHGVTSYTANLIYKDQSGALNEGISDIFGESVEAWVTGNQPDWIIGTKLTTPLRDMKNPGSMSPGQGWPPYPSKMSEYVSTDRDNGGVHVNSSIVNHAYYLLSEGLNGAIGIAKAEKIFYKALTTHLVQNSQFIDMRLACIAVAENLYGAGSTEALKVAEAFTAVEIGNDAPTPDPPSFPEVSGTDSVVFVFSDPDAGYERLGRREDALGDPAIGSALSSWDTSYQRPAVAGDGSWVLFVDIYNDICWIDTNADASTPEVCSGATGFQGWVHSVAMSPDQNRYAFVFLDVKDGFPSDRINIYNKLTDKWSEYTLEAPLLDVTFDQEILNADAMDFSADGKYLIYDAYNVITMFGGYQYGAWSIYALELDTGRVFSLVPPVAGYDFGYPAMSQTTHNFMTFDYIDSSTGQSAVIAMDLNSGKAKLVAGGLGDWAVPSYTGDDAAIIFSKPDSSPGDTTNTGYSLFKQGLSADRITPSGTATGYLADATMGVVYRRGNFVTPQASISATPVKVLYSKAKVATTTSHQVLIKNNGTSDLKIKTIAITGPNASEFATQTNCQGQVLPGTGSCVVKVLFTPQSEGVKRATLTIASDDPTTPLLDIPLKTGDFPWAMFLPAIIGHDR